MAKVPNVLVQALVPDPNRLQEVRSRIRDVGGSAGASVLGQAARCGLPWEEELAGPGAETAEGLVERRDHRSRVAAG